MFKVVCRHCLAQDMLDFQLVEFCIPGVTVHARPSSLTHLLVVDTQTCGSFMRAKVSLGPPKQAAQLGAAGGVHPAASKICAAVLPSQPATGKPYRSAHTCRYWSFSACCLTKEFVTMEAGMSGMLPGSCRQKAVTREAGGLQQEVQDVYLLCGGHQEGGHLDLPACPVQQLRSRHEVLCLASCARSAQQLMLGDLRPHYTAEMATTASPAG